MYVGKFATTLVTMMLSISTAMADTAPTVTANIGLVSDYVWRGVSQTRGRPAVQGGIDFADPSGFSLGTWASNVDFDLPSNNPNYEWDFYAGYSSQVEGLGYNITTAYYAYPNGKDSDFWELGLSGTWDMFTVGLAYTLTGQAKGDNPFRNGDVYYYGSMSYPLPQDFKLGVTLGYYDFDRLGGSADYINWQVSISKEVPYLGTFSFTYDQNDGGSSEAVATDNDPRIWIGIKKTF
ncbi:hypothetical protein TI04_03930 [Achromatium sp. WMS2]|nr:hypothetical protein TI04_03930 [Achromatium sp. WMS2]